MTANELRTKFLDFFQANGHQVIPSASLIPENDPTVLFTTAGMHPLVPYLLGQNHPAGARLASCQKCLRTNDIDEVGDLTHLTFFEMLGNWSLGDYFKAEAIDWSWEFLTSEKYLNLDKNKLAVSVYLEDDEAYQFWLAKGIKPERIVKLDKTDNWWGPAGQTGPCGPDTEMFYWVPSTPLRAPTTFDPEDKQWVEIWNDVFMAFDKTADGSFTPLAQKNVDTGMGLERVLCVMNQVDNVYQTDLFTEAIGKLEELSGKKYQDNIKAFRIITDHVRAATMIIGDNRGVGPSNTDQGYVVRKLIRRAVRYGWELELPDNFIYEISKIFISSLKDQYPELINNQEKIQKEIEKEEHKFKKTLANGLKVLDNKLEAFNKVPGKTVKMQTEVDSALGFTPSADTIDGKWIFDFFQSYGFPFEMLIEELRSKDEYFSDEKIKDLQDQFNIALKQHQELSRTAAVGKFKGGLADDSVATTRLHTAAHLLIQALRQVLGATIIQKGANITAERLRFDFTCQTKLTPEQIKAIENIVNEQIARALPVNFAEMSLEEAEQAGAIGTFKDRYGERVKVYAIGDFSKEVCGGPHVANTKELGKFKIIKEEGSSAGVRRIKAILE